MRLQNRIAVITGGAQGIGAAIATRFAQDGAKVVIADINEEKAKALVSQLKEAGADAMHVLCDVSDAGQVENLFTITLETFGKLDVLVNNAALVHHPDSNRNFLELSKKTWLRALEINLTGMFYCSQRAGRIMVKQVEEGKATGGVIINMSSGGGSRAHRHLMAYDTTKGGIEAATRAMALDMAPWKIRVNTVVPGNITVDNALGGATGPEAARRTIPLGHAGSPNDIAAAAAFLASDDTAYITGQRIVVDGGMDAQLRSPAVDVQIDLGIAKRIV
ncbi:MAG TPA: SDR family NAD(P)-dependent oxidoreductase [Anaerolineales bacterium]|nr:SDR family NAD(P)-dependent oxidoreductase [Anaerolineales bacterium]